MNTVLPPNGDRDITPSTAPLQSVCSINRVLGDLLGAHGEDPTFPVQGARDRLLVRELRSHTPQRRPSTATHILKKGQPECWLPTQHPSHGPRQENTSLIWGSDGPSQRPPSPASPEADVITCVSGVPEGCRHWRWMAPLKRQLKGS